MPDPEAGAFHPNLASAGSLMFTMSLLYPVGELAANARRECGVGLSTYDHPDVLLQELCASLADAGVVFVVEGFGQRWPVDISTHLDIVLQQLPAVLGSMSRREPGKVDFYGGGIKRSVRISAHDDVAQLTCRSWTSWEPVPSKIQMPWEEIERQLRELSADFCRIAGALRPSLANHPLFHEWMASASRVENAIEVGGRVEGASLNAYRAEELVRDYANLQRRLIETFTRVVAPKDKEYFRDVKDGQLVVDGMRWSYARHGVGMRFVDQHGRWVDVHDGMYEYPAGITTWRLTLYLDSIHVEEVVFDARCYSVQWELDLLLAHMCERHLLRKVSNSVYEPIVARVVA